MLDLIYEGQQGIFIFYKKVSLTRFPSIIDMEYAASFDAPRTIAMRGMCAFPIHNSSHCKRQAIHGEFLHKVDCGQTPNGKKYYLKKKKKQFKEEKAIPQKTPTK